jgi:glyceraldehyde 3-phosphate dehydrogenase
VYEVYELERYFYSNNPYFAGMKKIGVNGFGRIGRYFTRMALLSNDVEVAVVNDLAGIETLAHLLKYDSVHGRLGLTFEQEGNTLIFSNGKRIAFVSEKDPERIPWGEYKVEIVLESTGVFRSKEAASKHLHSGVQRVVLSAPSSDSIVPTVVLGANEAQMDWSQPVISNASCTTNSAAPLVAVLRKLCTIESAFITTVHSYTSDQRLHDAPHKDLRRARAAAESIVPTTTGAAKALARIFPDLEGHIGGCGVRVPVPNGSMTDLTLVVNNPPTEAEINAAMREASLIELKGILEYTEDPIVSRDIIGNPHSCILDAQLTSVVGRMVKVVAWYDNEAGYSNRLLDLMTKI